MELKLPIRKIAALMAILIGLPIGWSIAGSPPTIDFTPHGTQPGLQSPMASSSECFGCHVGTNPTERRFMPHSTWSGSMMANATRDPLFWAALDVANQDQPGVGDYCLRCHTPAGWLEGRVVKDGLGGVNSNGEKGCALTGDLNAPEDQGNDFAGVSCHLCHRQQPATGLPVGVRHDSGNLFIDDSLECDGNPGPCRIGPYRYPEPGINEPPHGAIYSDFVKQGQFCGTCHDVTTPITANGPFKTLIDSSGADTGIPFPIERTFSEWRASSYAKAPLFADGFAINEPIDSTRFGRTCQSCHMPQAESPQAMACQLNDPGSRAGQLPVHEFAGANAWIPSLIKVLYGDIFHLDRVFELNQTVALATAMLSQKSALMSVTLDPIAAPGQTLQAHVRVTNLSGHKLPTGYSEGRRMWLQVEARDANDALVFQSGAYDDASAVLTEDAQVRIYEVEQGIWNTSTLNCDITDGLGRKQFHFALNNCIRKDNRIPPLGFEGATDPEIRPVAYTYPETAPGSGILVNYDDVNYAIPLPANAVLPITVRVKLRHQIAIKEYIEFLRQQAIDHSFPSENTMCQAERPIPLTSGPQNQSRGQFMFDLWSSNGKSPPVTMQDQTSVSSASR